MRSRNRLLIYPHARNLSVTSCPIRMRPPTDASEDAYPPPPTSRLYSLNVSSQWLMTRPLQLEALRDDGLQGNGTLTCRHVAAGGQPVGEHEVPGLGHNGLGVELDASRGRERWRTPMMMPDSVLAETSSSSGMVAGSIVREW